MLPPVRSCTPVGAGVPAAADKKQFRHKHEGTLILRSGVQGPERAGAFKAGLTFYALKAEHKQPIEQKDPCKAAVTAKPNARCGIWYIARMWIGILRTTPGKEQMQER